MSARLISLALAAFFLSTAFAAPASVNPTKEPPQLVPADVTVQVKNKLTPSEFESVRGAYKLSDGRSLRIWSEQHRLFADTGTGRFEIVPESPNIFVSRDKGMKLSFQYEDTEPIVTVSEK